MAELTRVLLLNVPKQLIGMYFIPPLLPLYPVVLIVYGHDPTQLMPQHSFRNVWGYTFI